MKQLFLLCLLFTLGVAYTQETVFLGTSARFNSGTVFKVNTDGSASEAWHTASLPQQAYDVQLVAIENKLYGTTSEGGASGDGLVFRVDKDGSNYEVLHEFSGEDGATPFGGVTYFDGRLWGACRDQGGNGNGNIYSLQTDGLDFLEEYNFPNGDGGFITTQLIVVDNKLYGTQASGVFVFDPDTKGFTGFDIGGGSPRKLLHASNGLLYGVTGFGGNNSSGTLYTIEKDGSNFTILHEFGFGEGNIGLPFSSLIELNGKLYGGSFNGLFAIDLDGNNLQVLYTPPQSIPLGDPNDFSRDFRGGVVESNGKLWGMTFIGGTSMDGTIFSIDTDGSNFTKVVDFDEEQGSEIWSTFLVDGDRLWGITARGGSKGNGTIFSIKNDGTDFLKAHDFNDTDTNGRELTGELVQVGNEVWGVSNKGGESNDGTIFKIDIYSREFTKVHDFGSASGANPVNGLVQYDGQLWGVTRKGGANDLGTIYSIAMDGTNFTKHHDFESLTGAQPANLLTVVGDQLWGATEFGGSSNQGALFRINSDGTNFQTVHHFSPSDASQPRGSLVESGGRVWGTTVHGPNSISDYNEGILFSIQTDGGDFQIHHQFLNASTDFGLTVNQDYLWGVSYGGGADNRGFIYSIKNDGSEFNINFDLPVGSNKGGFSEGGGKLTLYNNRFWGITNSDLAFSFAADGTDFSYLPEFESSIVNNTRSASLLPVFIKGEPSLSFEVTSKSYGDTDFQLELTTESDAEVSYISSDQDVLTISQTGLVSIQGAGVSTITTSQQENDEYLEETLEKEVVIQKASLTVSAEDKEIDFGQVLPDLTVSYDGFVNGDNVDVLDEIPLVTTTALADSGPGTYDIVLNGGSDDDYAFQLVNGELLIRSVLGLPAQAILTIYPNPSSGIFHFRGSLDDLEVEVLDLMGRRILRQDAKTLDLSNQAPGEYLLRIFEGDNVLETGKIVVR